MRFISTFFQPAGLDELFDLNSVAIRLRLVHSTPKHPSGKQYADYLSFVVESFGLRVELSTEVTRIARW